MESVIDYSIFFTDPDGYIMTWNTGAERILGWTEAEIIGQDARVIYTPEDRAKGNDKWEFDTATSDGRVQDERWHIRKDGSRFWGSGILTALRDEAGALRGYCKILRDLTVQHEARVRERRFVREMLFSLTEGRLRLCETEADLPAPLAAQGDVLELSPSTLRRLRIHTQAVAASLALPMIRVDDLITAVGEASMNAVVHGSRATGMVRADTATGVVQVWITDKGSGISDEAIHRATLEKGFSTAGTMGHGFSLILATSDRVYLLTSPQGTTVVVEQTRQTAPPAWLARA